MKIIALVFGPSWKTSAFGLLSALALAGVTYAQAQPEPGWYVVALGLAALGRLAKDADKSGTAAKPAP